MLQPWVSFRRLVAIVTPDNLYVHRRYPLFVDPAGRLRTLQTSSSLLDTQSFFRAKAESKICALEAQIIEEAPETIILDGRLGLHESAMGLYFKQQGRLVNGAPLYTMEGRNDYRFGKSENGCWAMQAEAGNPEMIVSEGPEHLPIGASFKFFDTSYRYVTDSHITVRTVTPNTAALELTKAFEKIGQRRICVIYVFASGGCGSCVVVNIAVSNILPLHTCAAPKNRLLQALEAVGGGWKHPSEFYNR